MLWKPASDLFKAGLTPMLRSGGYAAGRSSPAVGGFPCIRFSSTCLALSSCICSSFSTSSLYSTTMSGSIPCAVDAIRRRAGSKGRLSASPPPLVGEIVYLLDRSLTVRLAPDEHCPLEVLQRTGRYLG